jgi:hypothetical protein
MKNKKLLSTYSQYLLASWLVVGAIFRFSRRIQLVDRGRRHLGQTIPLREELALALLVLSIVFLVSLCCNSRFAAWLDQMPPSILGPLSYFAAAQTRLWMNLPAWPLGSGSTWVWWVYSRPDRRRMSNMSPIQHNFVPQALQCVQV